MSWNTLLEMIRENRARNLQTQASARPESCPNCGGQLIEGKNGRWICEMGDWKWPG